MNERDFQYLAAQLGLTSAKIKTVHALFAEGATVPFVARYRKEMTGGMDEVVLLKLRDSFEALEKLHKRRENMLASLEERELLTPELRQQLDAVYDLNELEDLYLPYKPKRKTRAAAAREKGLEPLARFLMAQRDGFIDLKKFIDPAKGVNDAEEAMNGALDICAEEISENSDIRRELRELFQRRAVFCAKAVKSKAESEGAAVFRDYFDYAEPLHRVPSHRALAVMRGNEQGFLTMQLRPDKEDALRLLERRVIRNRSFQYTHRLAAAIEDSYTRLLMPSLENEAQNRLRADADEKAIAVFAANLHKLLMEAPFGQKRLIAVDPGFRTGCKTVALDENGKLLEHTVIFPENHPAATAAIRKLIDKHHPEAVAVGNGTAGRETEAFFQSGDFKLPVISVNESGASIYSAGESARREFPDLDLTVRGAVSIGRRLQDPLSELIKIDPKSIGVGQYQHDVNQDALKKALDDVVVNCVNHVGVELNSAGVELLTYVSGLSRKLAENIVEHRNQKGSFKSRAELAKVKGLGPKTFEQCAGFLRIRNAVNPLDASAIHPERYELVRSIAAREQCDVNELKNRPVDPKKYVSDNVGLPTVQDILNELARPGRDPRPEFKAFSFADGVHTPDDLKPGMKLPGIVTNVTAFGAFVDIGVHQDGLIHISKLADRFIKDPHEVVSVHDQLTVTVLEVDRARKRISLSLVD
jgi:uncharacterized protein